MNAPRGMVFDVSRACVDDGPGLRTVIFLKGCPLACPWCQNPEGQSAAPQVAFDGARCLACGACRKACPRHWPGDYPNAWRKGCSGCGACAAVCPGGARRLAGRLFSAPELLAEVLPDIEFLQGSGGGVTFSGGEPLAQAEFLFAAVAVLKQHGLSCAVETCGYWPEGLAHDVARAFDLVLFDLKHTDGKKFAAIIGRDNALIGRNLKKLREAGTNLELRLTLVPGFNDAARDLEAMAAWLKGEGLARPVRLQPFHRLAKAKESLFGIAYRYGATPPVGPEQIAQAAAILRAAGLTVIAP